MSKRSDRDSRSEFKARAFASPNRREQAVRCLLTLDLTDQQIARQLGLGLRATRAHVWRLARRCGVRQRADLVACLRQQVRESVEADNAGPRHAQVAMDWLNLAAHVLDDFQHGLLVTDENHVIVRVNPACARITGYTSEELIGKSPVILRSGHQAPEFYVEMRKQLLATGTWSGEVWNRRKNGEIYLQWLDIRRLDGNQPGKPIYVGVINDITGGQLEGNRIRHSALHDSLTGLANRILLEDRARQEIARAHRYTSRFAVFFIDLDRFKPINDSLGHAAGDQTLIRVAERLKQVLRANDTLARFGGDEFVVLAPDMVERRFALEIAGKLIEAIKRPIEIEGREYQLGASIGISLYPVDGTELGQLIDHADSAMYRAKENGGNTAVFHDANAQNQAADRLLQETRLREGMDRNEFLLLYQPKIDLSTQAIIGAEALLRWNNAERGNIPPDEFIPVAEQTGLIIPLGTWVLQEACRATRHLRDAGYLDFCMAVNVSPLQITRRDFLDIVTAAIANAGIPASSLQLEITESVFIRDPAGVSGILNLLTETGVSLALDDFGTGYSSLGYLKNLPFDTIKVDRQFINDVNTDRYNGSIARATLHLADGLDMKVVAEGVENQMQAVWLKDIGYHHAQGWLFGRPMTEADLQALLKAWAGSVTAPVDTEADRSVVVNWTDMYALGLPEIDAQHRALFDLINRLWKAIDRRATPRETMDLVNELENYALSHFIAEETIMRVTGYPEFTSHKRSHEQFATRVAREKTAITTGGMGLSYGLLRFLFDWLTNHILHEDKNYARFYEASRSF